MSKGTAILITILVAIAFLLLGINFGKKIERNLSSPKPTTFNTSSPALLSASPQPTSILPTQIPTPAACSGELGICGVGFAGKPLGVCCAGYVCKDTGNPDQGGVCIADGTVQEKAVFNDASCKVSFSYPGMYIKSDTQNAQSTVFTLQGNPETVIALSCMEKLPRPPVTSDKIEAITVDGIAATLYHDKTQSGTPRDEIIVKHPTTGLEIILAAPPEALSSILPTFRFLQ